MVLVWPSKDPDEVLDYQISWASRLVDDTIATSVWTVPDGITKNSDEFAPQSTTIWLKGGTAKVNYFIQNRITTVGGRTMDQTVKLNIVKSK
jgi:hypothetical protein